MTAYLFSGTMAAFYPRELLTDYHEAGTLPDDVMPVSDEDYRKFTDTPPPGMMRGANHLGAPVWVPVAAPSRKDAVILAGAAKHQYMATAEAVIAPLQRADKHGLITDAERRTLSAWEHYTVLLGRVNPADAPDINWPSEPTQ
ncbi:tail fiber assembly protein [Serratia fonticola]|uniref:tail fiber assembly protein n=1 Tax=Serratia fonticola TaxID=47917 RepID=UPI0013767363|nr:tail fiber assembly protein [Serratia fonticola]NBJ32231.1 tail fiber assembly protein [Serratia fonticola]